MERQLKFFFNFLANDKKLSDNTLQSYKRDLKQFRKYLEENGIHYNRVKEEDMQNYIKGLQEQGKKASSISRCIASIRSFYQFILKNKKIKADPTVNIQSPKIEKRTPQEKVVMMGKRPSSERGQDPWGRRISLRWRHYTKRRGVSSSPWPTGW